LGGLAENGEEQWRAHGPLGMELHDWCGWDLHRNRAGLRRDKSWGPMHAVTWDTFARPLLEMPGG